MLNANTGTLKAEKIQISMDGRGRALDNVFTERLWRTVKYEEAISMTVARAPRDLERWPEYQRLTEAISGPWRRSVTV